MNKRKFNFTKYELKRLYCDLELTTKEIGVIYKCSYGTIRNYLIKFGIKLRLPANLKQTERAKQKISKSNTGRKYSAAINWKKGKTNRGKSGKQTTNWKGGKTSDGHGYILIKKHGHPRANKQGYVKEHILIMEKKIGRYLTKNEIVHHINRKRDDNNGSNLKLFTNQKDHIKYHNLHDPINR